ncbi:MAG: MFS transporter [Chloroflexi bacterium]|nr:MFS transporter [Chloroflexota bacterium]
MARAVRSSPALPLLTAAIGTFLVSYGLSPVSAILPSIADGLQAPVTLAGWVLSAYLITIVGFLLIAGRLGDAYGHRRVFTIGLALYALAALGGGLAQSAPQLIGARALQGFGGALMAGTSLAIVAEAVGEGGRGKAVGLVGMAASLAAVIGAFFAVVFVETLNWRWVFFSAVPLAGLGLAAALAAGAEPARQRPRRLDLAGGVLLFAALLAFSLSLNHFHGGEDTFQDGFAWHTSMQGVALACLLAFLWVELRSPHPIIEFGYLRQGRFTLAISANTTLHMTMMASFFLFPVLTEKGLLLTPRHTAGLIIGILIFSVVLGPISGMVYDRTRFRLLTPASLSFVALGFVLLGLSGSGLGYTVVLGIGILQSIGSAFFLTPNNTMVMNMVGPEGRGFASGLLATSTQLGHGLAVSLATLVFSFSVRGEAALPAAYLQGFQQNALVMAAIATLGVTCALLPQLRREPLPALAARPPAPVAGASSDS